MVDDLLNLAAIPNQGVCSIEVVSDTRNVHNLKDALHELGKIRCLETRSHKLSLQYDGRDPY